MSKVYSELVGLGMSEESAEEISNALHTHDNLVTKDYLRAELGDLKHQIDNKLWIVMGTMTAIYGVFIGLMTWALK